jgi:hypothetical protein
VNEQNDKSYLVTEAVPEHATWATADDVELLQAIWQLQTDCSDMVGAYKYCEVNDWQTGKNELSISKQHVRSSLRNVIETLDKLGVGYGI